ncbi:hypothetical protein [Haloimpatiens lingqiaonensis]|uniref:hypothetical protein n=1 Tax=Haloimpatiens lingqiaonensis TaxID=1380675 RepID=UPI0010FEEDB8|nr:hypothetical protein [Haloimpatiens lingqiaonensis]
MYNEASPELLEKLNSYIKKGESVKVSNPVEYFGGLYRKVVFSKGIMQNIKGKESQFIFINEWDKVLDKKQVRRELVKLFYYYEIFFDKDNRLSIYKTVQSESDIIKDKSDYSEAELGLKILQERYKKKEEKEAIDQVLPIVKKVLELRRKNNEKLQEVIDIVEEMKKEEKNFSIECLEKIYPVYKEALMLNFKKVKAIYPAGQYYGKLKKKAEKTRRLYSATFRTRNIGLLIKTNYVMGYFEKVLRTYSRILDMSENDYSRFLKEAENNNFNNLMTLIRDI